ncbi:MAG: lytic transglycosylase domain-containing protein [Oligoflexia bacterium]|nr:lytic transglycosylase domain-containing protein [Oligoflexia bacterium]
MQAFIDGAMTYLERTFTQNVKQKRKIVVLVEWLMEQRALMSSNQKVAVYRFAGEETEAIEASEANEATGVVDVEVFKRSEQMDATEEELNLFKQITRDFKSGNQLSAVAMGITLMKKFPAGKRALLVEEQIIESYLGTKANGTSKLKQQLFERMLEGNSTTIIRWGKRLFEKLRYHESLNLLEQIIDKYNGNGPKELVEASYYAGVAAFYVGQYDIAKKYLNVSATKSAGSVNEQSVRSWYWLAMTALHQKKYQIAKGHFERLLQIPHSDEYETNAIYWRWRSLQQLRMKEQADRAVKSLMHRFPLSYYALKARMEMNGNIREGSLSSENLWRLRSLLSNKQNFIKAKLLLTESENRAWKRFWLLLRLGWYEEAQSELAILPTATASSMQAIYAKLWSLAHHHAKAIEFINRLWSRDASFMRWDLMRVAFPMDFNEAIVDEASNQQLDPLLIYALIRQESAYMPAAKSAKGALGLMQILPATGEELLGSSSKTGSIVEKLLTPSLNIKAGSAYVAQLLKKYDGNISLTLAAYNAGIGRIQRWKNERNLHLSTVNQTQEADHSNPFDEMWIDELPWKETQSYVKGILRNQLIYNLVISLLPMEEKKSAGSGFLFE